MLRQKKSKTVELDIRATARRNLMVVVSPPLPVGSVGSFQLFFLKRVLMIDHQGIGNQL